MDEIKETKKQRPPITKEYLDYLIKIGYAIAVLSVIIAFIFIANAPTRPFNEKEKAMETAAWVWAFFSILSGFLTAFLFSVIGKIGLTVVDIWENQKTNATHIEDVKT